MDKKGIINMIESHFKRKDVGVGILECISEQKDVLALADDIGKELSKAHQKGYDFGAQEAANDILNK